MSSTSDNGSEELHPAGQTTPPTAGPLATTVGAREGSRDVLAETAAVASGAEGAAAPEFSVLDFGATTALAVASDPQTALVPVEAPPPPPPPGPVPLEDPAWGGRDLLLLLVVLVGAMFVALVATAAVRAAWNLAHQLPRDAGFAKPDAFTAIPVEAGAYAIFLLVAYLLLRQRRGLAFAEVLYWNFPASRWWFFLGGGVVLAIAVGLLSRVFPIPKTVPLDDFFSSPAAAWLMAIFGVFVAPPVEELIFRGLLYPVLVRWLGRTFAEPNRLRHAALGMFVLAGWGVVGHAITGAVNTAVVLLLPFFFALPVAAFRIGKPGWNALRVATWAGTLLAWGAGAHALAYRPFAMASILLFFGTAALAAMSMNRALPWRTASLTGLAFAAVITSAAFALLHAEQLGGAWGPVALIFFVGMVLTIVRAITGSVAASTLVHMGYNGSLFGMMYLATSGFQHLERLGK